MITVVIPALNEQKTIAHVVKHVSNEPCVSEILVIDDKSLDDTIRNARSEKVRIYTSTKLGKGTSMREGMLLAKNDIIAFLDADILTYPKNVIEILTSPILSGYADFIKSYFGRQAGRVTELVAKPLLSLLFPDLARFTQPLSGMIAGRRSFFEKVNFENDYGVDVGLLIDMHQMKARIHEVDLGYIENRMNSIEHLSRMSVEVSRAILKRAQKVGHATLEIISNLPVIRGQMDFAVRKSLVGLKKMIIFDMDNTILQGSFIKTLAEREGFKSQLHSIASENSNPYTRTKLIATLLKGIDLKRLLEAADSIPVIEDFEQTVRAFRREGYICGIISDSYDCITNHLVNKYDLDFSIANELEFSDSIATGEVKIPSVFVRTKASSCNHDFCKTNAMREIACRYGIDLKNITAVGDAEQDICMIRDSGTGVAFCSSDETLNLVADKILSEKSFTPLIDMIGRE